MKKLITVTLLLTMLCALFVGSVYASDDVEVTVTSSATEVNVGDTITVTVAIDHEATLTGFGLPYEYDEEILKIVGVPAFASEFQTVGGTAMPSPSAALWLGMGSSTTYTGDLFTITFEVIGGTGKTTEIGVVASGTDGFKGTTGTLSANVTPATIKVLCAHANGTELQNAKEATCKEEGYTGDEVCKDCGETVKPGAATTKADHNYVAGTVVAPTCEDEGYTVYTCTGCGATENRDNKAALGHKAGAAVKENVVAATCTEAGSYDEVVYCSGCGEELSREAKTEAALGHNEVIDKAVAATCTETGLTEGKHCDRCDEVIVAQTVVAALNHNVVIDEAVDATCTKTGLTEGKHCDRCNEVLLAQETVAALNHTGGEATCVALAVCTRCGEEYGELNSANHKGANELEGAKDATCTENGATGTGKCSDCGAALEASEVIPALGHAWDEGVVTTSATCEKDGVLTYTCSRCGETETEVIPAKGHAYDSGVVTTPATCENDGEITFTCANDAEHTYTEKIDALGHEFDLEAGATVVSENGEHWFVCAREGCSGTTEKEACSVGEDGEEATCQTAAVCGICGESFGEPDPDAHDICWVIIDRTHYTYCDFEGCDYETELEDCTYEKGEYFSYDENCHYYVCDECGSAVLLEGETDEDRPGYGLHEWSEWITEEAPTATYEGYAFHECEVCGAVEWKTLPATGSSSSGSSNTNSSNIPDTGDDSSIALMAIVLTLCATGIVVLTTKKRKNEN